MSKRKVKYFFLVRLGAKNIKVEEVLDNPYLDNTSKLHTEVMCGSLLVGEIGRTNDTTNRYGFVPSFFSDFVQ